MSSDLNTSSAPVEEGEGEGGLGRKSLRLQPSFKMRFS